MTVNLDWWYDFLLGKAWSFVQIASSLLKSLNTLVNWWSQIKGVNSDWIGIKHNWHSAHFWFTSRSFPGSNHNFFVTSNNTTFSPDDSIDFYVLSSLTISKSNDTKLSDGGFNLVSLNPSQFLLMILDEGIDLRKQQPFLLNFHTCN